MISEEIQEIRTAVLERFPHVGSLGIYNRRKISGSTKWSQHSWGNAWDIAPPEHEKPSNSLSPSPTLDAVFDFLLIARQERRLPIRVILWRTRNHWDHIHVAGDPLRTGTPPILSNGQEESDMNEMTLMLQEALKAAGMDPGPLDGIPGPKTSAALVEAFKSGNHDPRLSKMLKGLSA